MNTLCKIVLILYFLLDVCWQGYAQTEKLRFEHININNGLSQSDVLSIKQDSKGYIWIGTLDGLNKYDGYQFTTYHHKPFDTTSLTMNAVRGIWDGGNGSIWVHPINSDINLLNPTTETFSVINPLPAKDVRFDVRLLDGLIEDKEGMIWVCNEKGQLCRFDKKSKQLSGEDFATAILKNPYNKKSDNKSVQSLFKDKKGTLWIGSSEGLHQVQYISNKNVYPSRISFIHYWYNPKDTSSCLPVNRIFEDHTGKLWLGTPQGLACFDPKTKRKTLYSYDEKNSNAISSNKIMNIAEDAQGNLWVATLNGLNKLNKARTQFTRFYHDVADPTSLSSNAIWALLIDRSNTLWVGTIQGGISKVNLNYHSFPLYQHNPFDTNSLSSNYVTAICEDKDRIVWIGTMGGGLDAWNRTSGKFTHYRHNPANPTSLFSDTVNAILEDRSGNLWIGSGMKDGIVVLSQIDRKTGTFKHHLLRYPSINNPFAGPVLTMYQDKAGLLWIGTTNGIITSDLSTMQAHHYPYNPNDPDGLSDPWIFSFYEDSKGNIWVGTSTERLNVLDRRTGKYTHYAYNPRDTNSISSSTVRCFYEDSKGTLWLGTFGGGLCRFNPESKTFTAFTTKHGLPSNTIHTIQEDNEGNLWLGTNNGLSKFSLSNHNFTNYDSKDGLQSNQFTVGHVTPGASFKGSDGTLYFGGMNGFNAFNPKYLQNNQYIPPIVITQFKLFDKPLPGKQNAKEIELDYNQNFFSFEFAALDYTNSNKNQYAYKLESVDKDWVYSGTRRIASYTDLAPGNYIFRVKGTNSDGLWNEKGTTLLVNIHPPWWRTDLAYAFYTLCFLAIVFAVHSFQKQRVIRRERERAKEKELEQAKEIEKAYHELKNTQLQLIQKEKMASLGELTAGIAHEIQNPLNFVNNFSELNAELIEELQQELNTGNSGEALLISNDIRQNGEKIVHHGKRADAIVKGMLQHSRASTGQKEFVDINALTDEHLRLSFHGMRAKDKGFDASVRTDFDAGIGKLNIVPQDIGRVLLNLFNNAFYSVSEKKKSPQPLKGSEGYEPIVSVCTKKLDGKVEIHVKDNGNGIPQNIVNKIFQPFFTTKPTGEGTGLGLSISYDIIKAHGGEFKVESKEGEGAEFILQLPVA